uniref:Uncharacterized protein n=1 Tax=Aegilops tauschii subsp. strangulata TaxID=200361 RepID=A0A453P1I3_AEGTS
RGGRVRSASSPLLLFRGGRDPPAAMAKYNVVQKSKRESSHDRKRRAHGDPNSGKLKHHNAPIAISGKRKRKLLRRLNRVGSIPFRLPSY